MVRLDTARASRMSAQSSIIDSQMPAVLKQVETFGDNGNAAKLIAAYQGTNPESTAAWKEEQTEKLAAAKAVFPQQQAMQNMSAPEMDGYIQKLRTAAGAATPDAARLGNTAYEAAMAYKKQRDDEFYKDPAAYETKNNQTIGMLFQRFQSTQAPEDFQKYAQYTLANQQHLEPDAPGHLVTPEIRAQWAGYAQQITTGGAPVAQQVMAKGAQQYGAFWPRVSQELMEHKILTGPQFVAASMYGKPNAYGVATDVLIASATPWKDLVTTGATKNVTEMDAVSAAATAFAPFEKTLKNVANGPQLIGAYRDALARTLLYRGDADSGTASDVAGKMIADAYQTAGTARIPLWAGVDTGKVSTGLDHATDHIDTTNIVVPPSFSGLGPNDQKENYLKSLSSTAHWYTNSDEKGVTLYDVANHNVMMRQGGKLVPVTMTWKQLEDLGEQNLSPLDRVGRFFTQRPQ